MSLPFALITGGTSGIGRAIAINLCVNYDLILIYKSNANRAAETKREILAINPSCRVHLLEFDIKDSRLIKHIQDQVGEDFGKIKVLVNNGGSILVEPILISDPENAIRSIEEHLFSSIRLVYALTPIFRKSGGGKIIHIGSIASIRPYIGSLGYSVAKSALLSLSQSIVSELSGYGITSNCILPGYIETPGASDTIQIIKNQNQVRNNLRNRFVAPPEAIAHMVSNLLDEGNHFINGAEIVIDGGLTKVTLKGAL